VAEGRGRAPARGAVLVLVLGAACQLPIGSAGRENLPRRTARARLALVASSSQLREATLAALASQPNLEATPLDDDGAPMAACARADAAGFDYLATARLVKQDAGSRCDSYEVAAGPPRCSGRTALGPDYMVVRLALSRTARCGTRSILVRTVQKPIERPFETGEARATAAALADLPRLLADLLPDQIVLDDAGRVPLSADGAHPPDGVFIAYREGKRVGALRLADAGMPGERQDPLVCCFAPAPHDLLVRAAPHVLEVVPSVSGARLVTGGTAHAAAGYGVTLGLRDLTGGWQGGVELDQLFTAHTNQVLGTFEAGYGFRPAPRWALSLLAGGGGSFTSRRDPVVDEADGRAAHALALARLQLEGRQWFARLPRHRKHRSGDLPAGRSARAPRRRAEMTGGERALG
jgi:hypothetical protein